MSATAANSENLAETKQPSVASRAEQIRAKREAERIQRKAKSIALQACLVPFLIVGVVLISFALMNRPNLIIALINLSIIMYASLCTVRTWINIAHKLKGLWFQAIIATIINGLLLAVVGLMVARLIKGF